MDIKEVIISFKVTETKKDEYGRWWRAHGFRSRSDFLCQAADAAMNGGLRKSPLISSRVTTEFNIQLGRANANMMAALTLAANTNTAPENSELLNVVKESLSVLKTVGKKGA